MMDIRPGEKDAAAAEGGVDTTRLVAVIGDVVGSRGHPDRGRLQSDLGEALSRTARSDAVQPFTATVGDEFQGLFARLDEGLQAILAVRARLAGRIDLRFGIGVGEVATLVGDAAPFGQDGPGWWRAREALDLAEERARGYGWPLTVRSVYVSGEEGEQVVNGHLMMRDHILASIDEVDGQILIGLMEGETQSSLADRLGLDKSSVSRRVSQHGLSALLRSTGGFDEVLG